MQGFNTDCTEKKKSHRLHGKEGFFGRCRAASMRYSRAAHYIYFSLCNLWLFFFFVQSVLNLDYFFLLPLLIITEAEVDDMAARLLLHADARGERGRIHDSRCFAIVYYP